MKKFYTALALGVAVSASAIAAPFGTSRVKTFVPVDQVNNEMATVKKAEMKKEGTSENTRAASDMKADYSLLYYCSLVAAGTTDKAKGYTGQFLHIVSDGDAYKLLGLAYDFEPVTTLQDDSFSVAPQNLGSEEEEGVTYMFELKHYRWNDDGQGFYEMTDPIVFQYDEKYGEYAPDLYDILAIELVKDGETLGYYFMGYALEAAKMPNVLNNEGWKNAGSAKFTDGFVVPGITGAPNESVSWDVPVQVLEEDPSILRLVNPYAEGVAPAEITKYNTSNAAGAIYLDIANPASVYVMPGYYSGLYLAPLYTAIYATNLPGYYKYYEEMEDSDIIDGFEGECGTLTETTLTIPLSGFGDCPFFTLKMQNGSTLVTPFECYFWTNQADEEIESTTIIELPAEALSGVEEIGAEEMNAPVKYYNLQGVEIAAPAKGELVIKKQGSKATKAIVR